MRVKWLDREMLIGPYLTLVTNQEQFDAAMKHLKQHDIGVWLRPSANAQVSTMEHESHGIVCVVSINPELSTLDAALTLSHEAYHIFCRWMEHIGEESPGEEIVAHSVKNIAVILTDRFIELCGE